MNKEQKIKFAARELVQAVRSHSHQNSMYIQERAQVLDHVENLSLLEVVFEAQTQIQKRREQEDREFMTVVREVQQLLGERALKQELMG